jgi:HEAT repeat protein
VILAVLAIGLAALVALELAGLAGRRAWLQWKLERRQPLVHEAFETLTAALVVGTPVEPPAGWARRHAFRLAALELNTALSGESCARLTRLVEDAGVLDQAIGELRRSPRVFARRTAADELGAHRSRRAAPAFEARLDDRDAIVRVACARGLLRIGALARLDRILEVLDGDALAEPVETTSAYIALAEVAPDELVRLHAAARSPNARSYAALVLARTHHEEALPALREALAADNALLVTQAIHGIAATGGARAAALLEELVEEPGRDAAIRELAGRELAHLHAVGAAR